MKRRIKSLIAISLVACMTLGSTVLAFAEDVVVPQEANGPEDNIPVDGNINTNNNVGAGAQASDGGQISVSGSVNNDGSFGVKAAGEGSKVTVEGDVTANEEGAVANDGGEVIVKGNVYGGSASVHVEPYPSQGGSVTVGKDAIGDINVIEGTVNVLGNVTGSDLDSSYFGATIFEVGDSSVSVAGDVTAPGTAIRTDGDSIIAIGGTINASSSEPVIVFDTNDGAKASTIVVYEIKGNLDNLVKAGDSSGAEFVENKNLKEEQIKNIFYIIKKDSNVSSISGARTNVPGCAAEYCAPENTVITVSVKEGYGLSAGSIEVTRNADGSYSITVPRGGGVSLEAIKAAVEKCEEESSSSSSGESTTTNTTKTEEAAVPVSVVAATVDPVSMGEAAYTSKVTSMIVDAPYGGTIEINVTSGAYLNDLIISALETRSDVSLKINVVVDGVPYVLNIPAGFNLRALLGADGKIDLQKLIAAFGTAK